MSDLTAKTFEKPLLVTLGQLSSFTQDVVVPAEDTYQPVMDRLGIADINAHGTNDATGLPMVTKWIQWAFKALREQGLAAIPEGTRGKWMLTVEGIAEARKLEGQMSTMTTPTTPDPVDAVSTPFGKGFSDNDSYHPDPYIRKLALSLCSCKGGWADRSPACKVCDFKGTCRNAQAALLSQLAKTLEAEDAAGVVQSKATPAAPAAPVTAAPPPPPTGPVAAAGFDANNYDWAKVDHIVVRVDTPCTYCQNVIRKGEKGAWVEPKDGIQAEIGMFHAGCFAAAKAGA